MRTSQMTAAQPIVVADAPAFPHGETAEKPMPVPSARSASDIAAATNAPATTAPQDTPETFESFAIAVSENARCAMPRFLREPVFLQRDNAFFIDNPSRRLHRGN